MKYLLILILILLGLAVTGCSTTWTAVDKKYNPDGSAVVKQERSLGIVDKMMKRPSAREIYEAAPPSEIKKAMEKFAKVGYKAGLWGIVIMVIGLIAHLASANPAVQKVGGLLALGGVVSVIIGIMLIGLSSVWVWLGILFVAAGGVYYMEKHKDYDLMAKVKEKIKDAK